MAILVSEIVSRCEASLDANGSEFYLFDQDYKPAIQSAQELLVSIINSKLGDKKMSEEVFQDLMLARVFQTSQYSRILFNPASLGHEIWSILSVEPNPNCIPAFSVTPVSNPQDSLYRDDLSFYGTSDYAARLTSEEWAFNNDNPMEEGHDMEPGEQPYIYGYLLYNNFASLSYTFLTAIKSEVEIRPPLNQKACVVRYVQVPPQPQLITDTIRFPAFCLDLLVAASLNYISIKQGDGSPKGSLADATKSLLSILIPTAE